MRIITPPNMLIKRFHKNNLDNLVISIYNIYLVN